MSFREDFHKAMGMTWEEARAKHAELNADAWDALNQAAAAAEAGKADEADQLQAVASALFDEQEEFSRKTRERLGLSRRSE